MQLIQEKHFKKKRDLLDIIGKMSKKDLKEFNFLMIARYVILLDTVGLRLQVRHLQHQIYIRIGQQL